MKTAIFSQELQIKLMLMKSYSHPACSRAHRVAENPMGAAGFGVSGRFGNQWQNIIVATLMFAWSPGAANAAGESSPAWNEETLTGDWSGKRSALYNKGISLEFVHKSDVLAVPSGGIKRGTAWMGNTEARIKMDLEKLMEWSATSAYIHYHSQLGSKFNRDYVGSFIGVDNIENGVNTGQFDHAWVQKSFSDDRLSVLFGLYPVDSEFYITDTSGLFIQPPYGPANEQAQPVMGASQAPPVFPVGALAIRVKYTSPGQNLYLQGALTDGVPSDPSNPRGTHIQLNKGDGSLSIVEFGYTPQEGSEPPFPAEHPGELVVPEAKIHEQSETFNKTAIGFWRYATRIDDPDPAAVDASGNPLRHVSQGIYFLAERTLFVEKDHPAQGLSGFARFGTASKDVHQADWTGSLGLRYHGLFNGRDDDIAGIAITYNHASDKYRLLNNADSSQTTVEATYRAQLNPWFALLPTLQYFHNPNMDPTQKNAWVIGARAEINF
ncbi:MAG: carbohydrate porin [Nitrosomonadales bacterium]|nr:carbohydrate porin [Nitrosomonadales bacterium]